MATNNDLFNTFEREPVKPTKEQGVAGFSHFGGYLGTRERNASLAGSTKYTTYEKNAANIAIIAASVRLFVNLAAKANWSAEPVDDSSQAQQAAELVDEMMQNTSTNWSKIVRQSAMFRFHGFSVQEWTLDRPNEQGIKFFKSIETRPQRTIDKWDIDEKTGQIIGFEQTDPNNLNFVYLPRAKTVYLVDDTLTDSPEGMGLFRHMAESASRLTEYQTLEQQGFERDMRGIPVGRIPYYELQKMVKDGKLSQEDASSFIRAAENFLQTEVKQPNTAVALDSKVYENLSDTGKANSSVPMWDVELLQGNSPGLEEIHEAISRLTTEIARIAGTEVLMLGEGGAGSLALSEQKNNSLYLQINSCLKDLKEAYQRDLVDVFWAYNGFDDELKPELKVEEIAQRDADTVAAILKDMAAAGAPLSPDDEAINDVRSMLGISNKDLTNVDTEMQIDAMGGE